MMYAKRENLPKHQFPQNTDSDFFGLGIAPAVLEIISRMKFHSPTPIQHKAIPPAIDGNDVLGIAQTGTGKTLAFGVPMIQRLAQGPGRGLILAPTRELAMQIDETMRKLGEPFNTRSAVLIGGMNMAVQVQILKKPATRVLIATPGRLLDHLEHKTVRLDDIKIAVLDEADRMLDMGFAPQIQRIARYLPKDRQTLLFSATMPDGIMKIASDYMKLPIRVEIAPSGSAPEQITQELFIVSQEMKRKLLVRLLEDHKGSVLVFSRTKANARKITRSLQELNFKAAEIHANRSLAQRREALDGFKTGRYRILIATDIASRGIDVKGIELVINYDLPDESENYVHRIGRTGRAGREGHAISLATTDQATNVRAIEKLIGRSLHVKTHPDVPSARFSVTMHHAAHRQGHYGKRPHWHHHHPPQTAFRRRNASGHTQAHHKGRT